MLHAVPEHALPSLHCALLLAPSPAQIPLLQTEEAIAERFACLSLTRSACFALYCTVAISPLTHTLPFLSLPTCTYTVVALFLFSRVSDDGDARPDQQGTVKNDDGTAAHLSSVSFLHYCGASASATSL